MRLVDAVLGAGCLLLCAGAWLVYPPSAFLLAGAMLVLGALLWQLGERTQ